VASKRDADYFKRRLKRDFPAIYAEFLAKKYKSVRQAAVTAKLIRNPGRLESLKQHWRKATPAQQIAFLKWTQELRVKSPSATPIADATGRLSPTTVAFLEDWCGKHKLRPGQAR